jgi:polyhydroxyalkanoate synthesis regulator phasin
MGVHASYYAAIEMTSITGQTGWIDFKTTSSNSDYVDRIRGGLGNLQFFTNNGGERMVINSSGNVGVNQSSPSYRLDVSGDSRVVGKLIVQTNNSQNGVVCTGTDGGYAYYGYKDGDPGIKFTRTSVFTGEDSEYTLAILPAPGGTPRPNAVDLGSSLNYYRYTYTNRIYRNSEQGLSDDRIKTGETLVENATETLLKLKPQTYLKHTFEFDKFTEEEYSNVSSDNTVFSAHSNCWADQTELIENTIDQAEQFPYIRRRLSAESENETGLIAQDIWYDAPELRHIVSLPSDATPAEEKPTGSDDPQQDPDYDEGGWGTESASVSYTQLIPVLIKSNQELDARVADLESQLQEQASENQALRTAFEALESRIESLEASVVG